MVKHSALFATSAVATLLLTSCSSLRHDPNETYFLVTLNTKIAYWQTALAGLKQASREMGVKIALVGPDTYDTRAEHDEFQHVVQQKPSGIMVSAADANMLAPDINAALNQGIPVITVDSDAPGSKRLFFVGTDNYSAGMLGGQLLAKLLNGKGNVVVFSMPNQSNLTERLHGYQSAIESHPAIKITQVVDMKGDPTIAFDTAKQLVDGKQKPDAFVCLEAIACPEVGEVVRRENMTGKVPIIAMDTDQRTLALIQGGVISATIAQKPYTMAYYGTRLLGDLHLNPPKSLTINFAQDSYSPLPTFVDTGTTIVDKDNVASFIQQAQSQQGGGGQ